MQNFDDIPSPVLVTDANGNIQAINRQLLQLVDQERSALESKPMDQLFPLASRIFLQTHIWPILLRDGKVSEIRLQISHHDGNRTPVLVNCQAQTSANETRYVWILFITTERNRYEQELLVTRKRTESLLDETIKNTRFIRTLTDSFPNMIAYWDKDLTCQFANLAYLTLFRKTSNELMGIKIKDLLGIDMFNQELQHIESALAGNSQEFEREVADEDGNSRYFLTNYIPDRDNHGEVQGFFVLITNISEIRKSDNQIRLLASVFNATSEGIMVTDIHSTILSVNPAFCTLTAYTSEEVVGKKASILNSGRHDSAFFQQMYQHLRANEEWRGQVWNQRKDGQIFLAKLTLSSIKNHADEISHYVGVFHDITTEWERTEQIEHLALHDTLTGLPNRLLLMQRLQQLLSMAQRQQRKIAILFLDLDGFKEVNDIWGHDIGDQVLKAVSSRLQHLIRGSDTAARLGGDEFIILLDQPNSLDNIAMIATRIIDEINLPIEWSGNTTKVGASIGIALYDHEQIDAEQLLKHADAAMYLAKKSGKNRFHFYATNAILIDQSDQSDQSDQFP